VEQILDSAEAESAHHAHIPVHVISSSRRARRARRGTFAVSGEAGQQGRAGKAPFNHISSFVNKKVKKLLLDRGRRGQQRSIAELLRGRTSVTVVAVADTSSSWRPATRYGGLDLLLVNDDGGRLLEDIKTQPSSRTCLWWSTPGGSVEEGGDAPQENTPSRHPQERAQLAGEVLSDTALFLHRIEEKLPPRPERDPAQQAAKRARR